MSGFLTIRKPDETFEYTPAPTCAIDLRIVPDDVEKKLRKQATGKPKFHKGVMREPFDAHAYLALVFDYCIVSWRGVQHAGVELPCTLEYKLLLPEPVKIEIKRLCLEKEALGGDDDDVEVVDEKKS